MSTVIKQTTAASTGLAPLRNGDQLDQRTFHERYSAMPEDFRAELIGGTVFVPSPVNRVHAATQAQIMGCVANYSIHTGGVEPLDHPTVILDDENEPQPDAVLRIADEYGGGSFTTDAGYVAGRRNCTSKSPTAANRSISTANSRSTSAPASANTSS